MAISEARTSPGATTPPLPTVSKPLRVWLETKVPALAPPTVTAELVRLLSRMSVLAPCTEVVPARVLLAPLSVSVPPPCRVKLSLFWLAPAPPSAPA